MLVCHLVHCDSVGGLILGSVAEITTRELPLLSAYGRILVAVTPQAFR